MTRNRHNETEAATSVMSTIFGYKSRAVLFQYTWLGYFDEPLAHPDEDLSGDCENIYMQQEDVYSRAFRN